jgi:Tfp pilus assembly protein PilP
MRPNLVVLVTVVALAGAVYAQAPSPAPSPAAPGPDIKTILEQGLEPSPTGYTYSPQGRRDPFVSLNKPVEANRGPGTRPPGLKGFLIQEVSLRGIVKDKTGYIAILLGTDGKSYFVRVGERLYDGVVTAIDAANITFRQEVTDPLSPVKSRDVKKSLYPSEEIR